MSISRIEKILRSLGLKETEVDEVMTEVDKTYDDVWMEAFDTGEETGFQNGYERGCSEGEKNDFRIDELEKAVGMSMEDLSWKISKDFTDNLIQFINETTEKRNDT